MCFTFYLSSRLFIHSVRGYEKFCLAFGEPFKINQGTNVAQNYSNMSIVFFGFRYKYIYSELYIQNKKSFFENLFVFLS